MFLRKYPALLLMGAVVLGIVIGDSGAIPSWLFLCVGVAFAIAALALLAGNKLQLATILSVVAVGALGGFHYVLRYVERGPRHVANLIDSHEIIHFFGQVDDWPDLRVDRTDYAIALDSVESGGIKKVDGRILLRVTDTSTALQRGDRVEFYGRVYLHDAAAIARNSSVRRLALREICGTVYLPTLLNVRVDRRPQWGLFAAVDGVRGWILRVFAETLSPDAAALAGGFLLGETRYISSEVYTLFRDSGTLHVLAVSGSNVALVLLFALLVLRPFGVRQPWRGIVLLGVVCLFALMSYSQPSVIRASVMAFLVILAGIAGREYDLNQIVALTVFLILAVVPSQLFDVGFQLSAVTAWGLVLLVKPVAERFRRWHNTFWYRWLVFPIIISAVAQLCSAPVIAYYFGAVPLVSLPANLIVVPVTSLAVILLLVLLITYLLLPIIGLFIGSLVDPILHALVISLKWFHTWPAVTLNIKPLPHTMVTIVLIVCYFVVVILGTFGIARRRPRKYALAALLVGVNAYLIWSLATSYRRPPEIHFTSLPGGILALVDQEDSKTADLIIASGRIRLDNLDTRLFQPVLDMNGVKKLRNIFVLTATFDVIDDLLRTAVANQCARLYVAGGVRPSFEDYISYHPEAGVPPITYFGGEDSIGVGQGYHLGDYGVTIESVGHTYRFISSAADLERLPTLAANKDFSVVVSTRWIPSAKDWVGLRERGVTRIICSRIEQRRAESDAAVPSDDADVVLPDYTVDLYRRGPLSLPL